MKRLFSILVPIALLCGCQGINENTTQIEDVQNATVDSLAEIITEEVPTEKPVSDLLSAELSWSDSLLKMYMAFANNDCIKQAHKANFSVELVYDNTLKTDSAVYDIYRIGHEISRNEGADTRFIVDQWIYVDTLRKKLFEYEPAANKLTRWWAAGESQHFFYPVYELSSKTTAFVVPFREPGKGTYLDTIFNRFYPPDSIYNTDGIDFYKRSRVAKEWKFYDTTGHYWLMKSDRFEKEVKRYFDYFNVEFYVYGTKGSTRAKVRNVTFGLSECKTNIFAFTFDNSSLKSIGHPVFCSARSIELNYGKDYNKLEKNIDSYLAAFPTDYTDSITTKVLGNADNFYFIYHDDFAWGRNPRQSKCKFPDRHILLIEGKNILGSFGQSELDLFGIGCD
ncbi:hypothetical protein [Longitalea luteola]|uniref:hypothetical protein n=1 Tax=Longitalea luteola TaxID=2812563 RepID=UPI001A95D1C6|nr:hypothetical protein [Longitalea luteola]